MTLSELFGVWVNYRTKYDLIKWTAGKDFSFFENIFTRLSGFYFFINSFTFGMIIRLYNYDNISKNDFS